METRRSRREQGKFAPAGAPNSVSIPATLAVVAVIVATMTVADPEWYPWIGALALAALLGGGVYIWGRGKVAFLGAAASATCLVLSILVAAVSSGGTEDSQAEPLSGGQVTSTESEPPHLGCLAYIATTSEPRAHAGYPESDFEPVACTQPHQYELVERTDDVTCYNAVVKLINLYSVPGYTRIVTEPYGPDSCAFGRFIETTMQTDTYRISTNDDVISAFGACFLHDDLEAFLAGSDDYEWRLECYSGRVLGAHWSNDQGDDPQESCEEQADDVPHQSVHSAESTMGSEEAPRPSIRCAYVLQGVNRT